ncbi:Ncl1p, related [Eimeria brunetti]|uniref:Ncl1p, related n=1 Tax=Eimeria brunetti TaxID=51314 RepID=U6LI35_9EIME|nr:Ncl1p, related [Eimeria brunetti]
MARGKRSFRGAELMGKRRAAKYQRTAAEEAKNGKSHPTKEAYAEITYENAAYEDYYRVQEICPVEEWDNFMAIQRLRLPGQWDTASKVDMKKDEFYREIRSHIINEDFRGSLTRQEAVSMLPCLFLDIQPHHLVLDMCSSPGSKTSEMLDMLQWTARLRESKEQGGSVGISPVTGAVIANDVDLKRAVTLTHQVQKLASPSVAVSCLDASCFPTLHESAEGGAQKEKLQFDRILGRVPYNASNPARLSDSRLDRLMNAGLVARQLVCVPADVPCSGDGTLRKNVDLSILYRGLQLLRVNGRIVYSTCSLNPLEDEAVIATVLSQQKGRVEIVDPPELPGLKWSKGKSAWLVPSPPAKDRPVTDGSSPSNAPGDRQTTFFRTFDEVPEELRHRIRPTMFPPLGADSMSLEKCVRVLPHHNNTGGFFVCCLRKVAELDASQIFISNKSKVRAAVEEKQRGRNDSRGHGGPRSTLNLAFNDALDPPYKPEEGAATSKAICPVEPEPNPLLDGELLQEELNPRTQPETALGSVENVSERTSTAPSASEEEGSLYALAAAASKPGSLFHILLPANCDAEGSSALHMIFEFFGLDDRAPLLAGDLRDPANVASLDPNLLFRRVHSQKKMFLLSKKLAGLVKACYGTPGARPRKERRAHAESGPGELREQLDSLLRSKIKWVHAGATVLVKHSETKTGEEQGLGAHGWRVVQEGAALMATFMRRRIVFVSLVVGRLLLLPEARVVRLTELLHFESRKQVLNLSSCRDKDGSIEAGGVVCVICPTSVVGVEEFVAADAHQAESLHAVDEEQRVLAQKYPIKNNPCFAAISDSLCVACMLTKGGNLHAYMNKNEAKALAFHLFSMPEEELTTACNNE